MKKLILKLALALAVVSAAAFAQPSPPFYVVSPTTSTAVVHCKTGCTIQLDTGGTLDVTSGTVTGTLSIVGVTATSTEINKLASVVAGTASASKAAVLGASKNLDTLKVSVLNIGSGNTAAKPATCTVGDLYLDTQVPALCGCQATNTWKCAAIS